MDIQTLQREFKYNGVRLTDPNASFTLVQVRDFYATVYPEIVSADIEGPEQVGAKATYTFRRAVGTKGGERMLTRELALERLRATGTLATCARPANAITSEQAKDPTTRAIARIMQSNKADAGKRCLAPSSNHAVLP